jgi:hypothetical protein
MFSTLLLEGAGKEGKCSGVLLKKFLISGCSKMLRVLQVELREIPLRGGPRTPEE